MAGGTLECCEKIMMRRHSKKTKDGRPGLLSLQDKTLIQIFVHLDSPADKLTLGSVCSRLRKCERSSKAWKNIRELSLDFDVKVKTINAKYRFASSHGWSRSSLTSVSADGLPARAPSPREKLIRLFSKHHQLPEERFRTTVSTFVKHCSPETLRINIAEGSRFDVSFIKFNKSITRLHITCAYEDKCVIASIICRLAPHLTHLTLVYGFLCVDVSSHTHSDGDSESDTTETSTEPLMNKARASRTPSDTSATLDDAKPLYHAIAACTRLTYCVIRQNDPSLELQYDILPALISLRNLRQVSLYTLPPLQHLSKDDECHLPLVHVLNRSASEVIDIDMAGIEKDFSELARHLTNRARKNIRSMVNTWIYSSAVVYIPILPSLYPALRHLHIRCFEEITSLLEQSDDGPLENNPYLVIQALIECADAFVHKNRNAAAETSLRIEAYVPDYHHPRRGLKLHHRVSATASSKDSKGSLVSPTAPSNDSEGSLVSAELWFVPEEDSALFQYKKLKPPSDE